MTTKNSYYRSERQARRVFFALALSALLASALCFPAGADFAHPGVAHSRGSIDFVRAKIGAGEQPWSGAWAELRGSREASLSWTAEPHAKVERGPYNNPNIGSSEFSRDAMAAYTHALCWVLSDKEAHARKAAEIIGAWSSTLESIGNHDARLLVGMSAYHFCIAAELIKHTWDGWPEVEQARFAKMARGIWFPIIEEFYPSANGNWDASMLQAMMAMGVFLDDREMFDRARDYFLNGEGNGAIGNYFKESGQCQESGRDQAHTQMGLEFLANTCETAWIQGVDLYGALGNRLLAGFEYTAKYNLGYDVPYEPYRSFEGRYHYREISAKARGRLRPMYERVFNHYHNRRGLEAQYTQEAALKLRTGGRRRSSSHLDVLMYAGHPRGLDGSEEAPGPSTQAPVREPDTLEPLTDAGAPEGLDELWGSFDPRAEPLEVEVLKEWEEDGAVLRVLRYRAGIFRGERAMIAAIYGYPKGGEQLPGLVQTHGGGQYAHSNAVLTNAKRGYATISVAWAGRVDAPGYKVNPDVVKLFWDGATSDPAYKVTTDWGALDAYHAPSRHGGSPVGVKPTPYTLDAVESSRNCSYFLWSLAARRALTFLERQPEVDGEKLGIYGHSMGGKITVLTAGIDDRVKAAAPSCGGISNSGDGRLYRKTMADEAYLRRLSSPTFFLSPSNDFHGHLADLQEAVEMLRTDEWRITCAPHHNHQDTKEFEVATQLWFDEHLKGTFSCPETPAGQLEIRTATGVPSFSVIPDASVPILSVDIYYTQQGSAESERRGRINRFWHHAPAAPAGDGRWTGQLPLESLERPLWVYANVLYALPQPISGAGYYYRNYTASSFNLSSAMAIASVEDLESAGARVSLEPSLLIEDFERGWEKQWFTYRPDAWGWRTHKVFCDLWKAPAGAKLAFEARCAEPATLVVGLDSQAAEVRLSGGAQWEPIVLSPAEFGAPGDGDRGSDWSDVGELSILAKGITMGADGRWSKPEPELRRLRWIAPDTTGGR